MSLDRLTESFKTLVQAFRPLDYYALYQCTVVGQSGNKLDLKPDDARLPSGGLTDVPLRYGLPGVEVEVANGTRCLLGFEGGNPTLPFVHGFLHGATDLKEIRIKASVNVVVESPSVELAGDTHPAAWGDKVQSLLQGILSLLTTMGPIGNMGAPVIFTTDITGSSSYAAGGVVANVTAMAGDLAQVTSPKVKVG